jgi:hypothetical protein
VSSHNRPFCNIAHVLWSIEQRDDGRHYWSIVNSTNLTCLARGDNDTLNHAETALYMALWDVVMASKVT